MDKEKQICYICCETLEDNIVTLKCGHSYHYDCIYLTYKANFNNGISSKKKRECPYCRREGGFLDLKIGYMPYKGIHFRYLEYKETDICYIVIDRLIYN